MSSWMERVPSDEEPAALRRVPRGEPIGNDWPRSPRSHGSTSRYNSVALARDLNGATALDFNAYDFVRTLLDKYDLADIGDGELDANASLAALDGIEALLRRRRDIAARDESVSREDLRTALRAALKCREDTEHVADNVDTALSRTTLQAGDAAENLRNTVLPLSKLVERRRKLEEARDLVRLLDADEAGLNIVRASEVLKSLREEHRKGALKNILNPEDAAAAVVGLERCENELIESLAAGIRKKSDDASSSNDGLLLSASVLYDFATAACNLEKEDEFIEAYIDQLPIFAAGEADIETVLEEINGKPIRTDKDAIEIVNILLKARWECSAALREFVPMATEAFPHPLKAWAHLTGRLFEDKISPIAQRILEIVNSNQEEFENDNLDVRKLNVEVFSRVLRITACSVHDLIELCVIANEEVTDASSPLAGSIRREVVRKNFNNVLSELSAFIIGQLVWYIPAERSWAMKKAYMHAFAEVKEIEIRPMSFENDDAYSRFRSEFLRVAKKHQDMTVEATNSSLESMQRVASLLVLCVQLSELCDDEQDNGIQKDGDEDDDMGTTTTPAHLQLIALLHVAPFEKAAQELVELIEQISGGLLQCYLNNSETLLQGASHLVPTKSDTATRFESLWEDGLSPLSACVEVIGAMSGSDKYMENFLKTITLDEEKFDSMPLASASTADNGHSKCAMLHAVEEKIRIEHHREFNSGTRRLAIDTRADIDAAVGTVGTHLEEEYFTDYNAYLAVGDTIYGDDTASSGEASMAFVRASMVIDRQLGTCKSALAGEELDTVISSLAEVVRDAVVAYWVKCKGPFTLKVLLDARAIVNAFPAGAKGKKSIEVVAVLAQMHFDSVDEIWGTLESGTLPNICGDSILSILNKRNDLKARDRQKIRDVLFIDPEFTEEIL